MLYDLLFVMLSVHCPNILDFLEYFSIDKKSDNIKLLQIIVVFRLIHAYYNL